MIFLDTETAGLHGVPVIIQYAIDQGPIKIYNFWKNPIKDSMALIEWICTQDVCGFNLAFDWFHLQKFYNMIRLYPDLDAYPDEVIDELPKYEYEGRDGPCIKPRRACDLMLHARQGVYQSCMERDDIKIKKVPTQLAFQLAEELEKRIPLKDIYFARRKDKSEKKWRIEDIQEEDGSWNTDFKNVTLRFAASSALKVLAIDALDLREDEIYLYKDVGVDKVFWPDEHGYAPFALASKFDKGWPSVIQHHIDHWEYREDAREYASLDVEYLQKLYTFFGSPEPGDDNSELACMVASVRWKGFKIDLDVIKSLREKAVESKSKAPTAANYVKKYLYPFLNELEIKGMKGSTDKVTLEEMVTWTIIDDSGEEVEHPVVSRVKEVLGARKAEKRIEMCDKLIHAGRLHASLKVIGARSGRMSGDNDLNPQGIDHTDEFRRCFPLSFEDTVLCGGDFKSFEVSIADAEYNDPKLRDDLTRKVDCPLCKLSLKCVKCDGVGCKKCKQSGKCTECDGTGQTRLKIHGLFAQSLFPEETYESILASAATDNDMYDKGKKGLFSQIYFGNEHTLKVKLGIDIDTGKKAQEDFERRYKGIGVSKQKVIDAFQSMRQPGGIGSKVEWHEPADYMESMLGFRRYFTLENKICRALYELGNDPPKAWLSHKVKVVRRDREQSASGAVRSALFGAAFALQSANVRAAGNHRIQSTGAGITKVVQRKIWDLQPSGVHPWRVQPLNIHDEILTPTDPKYVDEVEEVVTRAVDSFKPLVPLIGIDWFKSMKNWSEKKG